MIKRAITIFLLLFTLLFLWVFYKSQPLERHITKTKKGGQIIEKMHYEWHPEKMFDYFNYLRSKIRK